MLKHVIAYGMHEHEISAAADSLSNAVVTDSYVVGDIDEDDIGELEAQGVIVDELTSPGRQLSAAAVRSGIGSALPDDELPPPPPGEPTQWLVTLTGPLLPNARADIASAGLQLETYLPNYSYVATGTPEQASASLQLPAVRDVVHYGPGITGAVILTDREPDVEEPAQLQAWDLWLTNEGVRAEILSWLEDRDVTVVGYGGRRIRVAAVNDPDERNQIASLNGVLSMVEHVPPKLFNDVARTLLRLPVDNPGANVDLLGHGEVVGIADTGLDVDHPDFDGRIVQTVALGRPGNVSDPAGHGTHVAGSLLGSGAASGGRYRGVAPEAQLYFQSILDPFGRLGGLPVSLTDLFEPAYQAGARVHSNSWGAATSSTYTIDANDVDGYIADRRDMLVVIAAGNEGTSANPHNSQAGFVDWLSVGSPATCKNALTVGAARSDRTTGGYSESTYGARWPKTFPGQPISNARVSGDPESLAAFSSRGPSDDHRIKPDLVAPGTDVISTRSHTAPDKEFWGLVEGNPAYAYMGGTSMACPLVAGCAVLTREYFRVRRNISPSAALLKATLVNGTRWLHGGDAVADHGTRPNYHQGFGAVDMLATLPMNGGNWSLEFADTWQDPGMQFSESGQRIRFQIDVAAGAPIRMCLAYTDLPGRGLQNDLSILVQEPSGTKLVGNVDAPARITRSDVDNNMEVIRVEDPAPGTWLIQIHARNLLRGPQDFAFVISGNLASPLSRVA